MGFPAQRIGILTGGGDCPGLNGVIRAVVRTAQGAYGAATVGIEDGFEGLVEGRMHELAPRELSGILSLGGTILGTSNKGDPWHYPVETAAGKLEIHDVSYKALRNIERWGLDAVVAVGGDGTMHIASRLMAAGVPCIRYRTVKEAMEDPQFAERGSFTTARDQGGEFLIPNLPFEIDGAKPECGKRVARAGEDTVAILTELGIATPDEITRLDADKVLVG